MYARRWCMFEIIIDFSKILLIVANLCNLRFFANIWYTISTKPIVFKFGLNIDIGVMHVWKSLALKFELQAEIYATYSLLVAIVLLLTLITVYAWVLPFDPRERFIGLVKHVMVLCVHIVHSDVYIEWCLLFMVRSAAVTNCWYSILMKLIENSQKSDVTVMCNCVFTYICKSIRHLNPRSSFCVGQSSLSIYMTMTICVNIDINLISCYK